MLREEFHVPARRLKERFARVRPEDIVVGWGQRVKLVMPEGRQKPLVLNGLRVYSKADELYRLRVAGVSVPEARVANPEFHPTLIRDGWLPRSSHHHGGNDLLHPPKRPDFFTRKLVFQKEFRVHVWKSKSGDYVSIRAGMKVPRPGVKQHEWIRSYDAGWDISYGEDAQEQMKQRYRDAAKSACLALGYDFGAVDIGVAAGKPVVLEVNSAPALHIPNTARAYALRLADLANGKA